MAILSLSAPELKSIAGLTVYLYVRSTGALVNPTGDALVENPAGSGRFEFDLAESRAGLGVLRCDVVDSLNLMSRYCWLSEEEEIASDTEPPEGMTKMLGYTLAILAGNISNAGTATEMYTVSMFGVTYQVEYSDLDVVGNRGTTEFRII